MQSFDYPHNLNTNAPFKIFPTKQHSELSEMDVESLENDSVEEENKTKEEGVRESSAPPAMTHDSAALAKVVKSKPVHAQPLRRAKATAPVNFERTHETNSPKISKKALSMSAHTTPRGLQALARTGEENGGGGLGQYLVNQDIKPEDFHFLTHNDTDNESDNGLDYDHVETKF
ncbi:hypothetical protein RFI_11896 [Reticulomyxa filosa]|uniref:Uncharacterized protein n=1 Tax=Reticulomyxa filosa TaxID=46433 RepID=X6NHL6_RETFI|nr:hypothetical protein RFI_11896 [Reticulomyxa filosa]|eukprot:ETO25244.1 hypothetical protein RFI_11896 [Reticulomyxa filosa]